MALSTEVIELMMLRLQDYSNQISAVGEGSIEGMDLKTYPAHPSCKNSRLGDRSSLS